MIARRTTLRIATRVNRVLLLLAIVVITTTIAHAQIDWYPANGNLDGGRVTAFAFDSGASGNIYAGSRCDLFRFDRQRGRWVVEASHLPAQSLAVTGSGALIVGSDSAVYRIASSGAAPERVSSLGGASSIVVAESGTLVGFVVPRYLVRSTDDGRTWAIIDSTLSVADEGRKVAVSPEGIFFSYGSSYGQARPVTRSDDDGVTWVEIGGIPSGNIYSMLPLGAGHLLAMGRFSGPDSLYLSTDNGATWSRSGTHGFHQLQIGPGNTIYATGWLDGSGSSGPYLHRSSDEGRTWTSLAQSHSEAVGIAPSGEIWSNAEGRIVVSSDGGSSWQDRTGGFNAMQVPQVQSDSSGRLFVIAGSEKAFNGLNPAGNYRTLGVSALYRSLDGGQSWRLLVDRAREIYGSVKNGMIYLPQTGKLAVLYSRDHGDSWDSIVIDNMQRTFAGLADNANGTIVMAFYGMGEVDDTEIAISTDSGRTWSRSIMEGAWGLPYVTESGRILISGSLSSQTTSDLLTSTDTGASWQVAIPGLNLRDIETNSSGEIFVVGFQPENVIYRSTDGGETFELQHEFPFRSSQSYLHFTQNGRIILTGLEALRSVDAGRTWDTVRPRRIAFLDLIPAPDGTIYAYPPVAAPWIDPKVGIWVRRELYRSSDDGSTWSQENDPTPIHGVVSLAITPSGQLFVGTNGCGLYSDRPTSRVATHEHSPLSISIESVEPNPMRGRTLVGITLATRQEIALTLIDLTGREIAALHRGVVDAGRTNLSFDSSVLGPGTYILSLRGADGVVSRRVVVLR